VNGGQVEDEIGIGRRRPGLAGERPANPGRSSRLEFAMEWRRPGSSRGGFRSTRMTFSARFSPSQYMATWVPINPVPPNRYCAIAVHGAQAGCSTFDRRCPRSPAPDPRVGISAAALAPENGKKTRRNDVYGEVLFGILAAVRPNRAHSARSARKRSAAAINPAGPSGDTTRPACACSTTCAASLAAGAATIRARPAQR